MKTYSNDISSVTSEGRYIILLMVTKVLFATPRPFVYSPLSSSSNALIVGGVSHMTMGHITMGHMSSFPAHWWVFVGRTFLESRGVSRTQHYVTD